MLVSNMLVTNIGGWDAGGTMVDAGRDVPVGGRRGPGPDDLEHRAGVDLGGAARQHPGAAVDRGRVFPGVRRGHAAGRAGRGPVRPQAAAAGLPLGPVLGGVLLQHFPWHSVFWINVPAVCLTLAAGAVLVPESRNPAAPPLDVPGVLLSAGAVTCLVWGVINGPEHGWTAPSAWALLTGSAVLLAAFLGRENRAVHPVIDRRLFADRRFTWGTAATVAVSVALFGLMFVIPQYLQSVAGNDPISAGLRLLPMMGGLLVAGGAASPVARAAGTRLTVAGGLVLLTAGLTVLSQVHLSTGYAIVATGLALCG